MALTKVHKTIIEKQVRAEYTEQISNLNDHALFHMVKGLDAKGNSVKGRLKNPTMKYGFEIGIQIATEVLESRGHEMVEFQAMFFMCEHL
jgi:hypothetical protein